MTTQTPAGPAPALTLISRDIAEILAKAHADHDADAANLALAPRLTYWEEMASHPGLIVCRALYRNAEDEIEEHVEIAFVGPVPTERDPLFTLGHGGDVWAIYGEEPEDITFTCNLWSRQTVPTEYEHLYPSTCRRMRRVGGIGLAGVRAAQAKLDAAKKARRPSTPLGADEDWAGVGA